MNFENDISLSAAPNKAERDWMDAITQMGCCICIREGRGRTPAEVHHMLAGGRRQGHLFTLPLCYWHHRSGRNDAEIVSRDQNRRRFEARYGNPIPLWESAVYRGGRDS